MLVVLLVWDVGCFVVFSMLVVLLVGMLVILLDCCVGPDDGLLSVQRLITVNKLIETIVSNRTLSTTNPMPSDPMSSRAF